MEGGGGVGGPSSVVPSLPYHVATPIVFRLAFGTPQPKRIVVMLQEEVAQRIVAPPGSMTYLGAALGIVAEARIVRRVPAGAFHPVPKVRSAIVRLDLRVEPAVAVDSPTNFAHFLRLGFTQPRKQLHNSLSQGLEREASEVRGLLDRLGIDPGRRPAELALDDWAAIYREAQSAGWLQSVPSVPGRDAPGQGGVPHE